MSNEMERFKGGVAVVTGAGSGIGEALARRAAAIGMSVVLADIAEDRVRVVAEAIKGEGGNALAVATDVSDPLSVEHLADQVENTFGPVRLLINNAGIEALGFSWELPLETWQQTLGVNITGVILGVRTFLPRMIQEGVPAFIANTSSVGALASMPVQSAYIMSKHAVLAYSECLRLEVMAKGLPVDVSVIVPGPVSTRIFADAPGVGDAVSEFHRAAMLAMIESNGIAPEAAAERILAQIATGQFWVSTHPELTRQYAADRASYLSRLDAPALSEELAATLGVISERRRPG